MKRTIVLFATMVLSLLVVSGMALAVTKIGTDRADTLMGTKGSDVLSGRGHTDWIDGRAGNDVIKGGPGNDDPLASNAIGMLDGAALAPTSYRVDRASTTCGTVRGPATPPWTFSRVVTATTS